MSNAPESKGSYAQAFDEIVALSQTLPGWQRDALRRIVEQGELTTHDLSELLELCKQGSAAPINPITMDHIPDQAKGAMISLSAIHGVTDVNALAGGQTLSFFSKGLTVVYGDNGAGKSGYIKVLKHSCRARVAKDERVLPNQYKAGIGKPTAIIDYIENGTNRSHKWVQGAPSAAALSSISVFDSRTAHMHVDQSNDVAYTPLPLKALEQLAACCTSVKNTLNASLTALRAQTPESIKNPKCSPAGEVRTFISNLGAANATARLAELIAISDEDRARLALLRVDLSSDPAKAVAALKSLRERIVATSDRVEELLGSTSDESVQRLNSLHSANAAAQEAASIAADQLFGAEPLPHVGSSTWAVLWESARRFSKDAYPYAVYPATDASAVCVLCQQPLSDDAGARLSRFEAFVQDTSKTAAALAEAAFETALKQFQSTSMSHAQLTAATRLIGGELSDSAATDAIRAAIVTARVRQRMVTRHGTGVTELPPAIGFDPTLLQAHLSIVDQRVQLLEAEDGSAERKEMLADRDRLADREWLESMASDVAVEIERRKTAAVLETGLKDTTTNKITTKSGDIAKYLVTNALRGEFAVEVDKLDLARLAIELRMDKSSYAIPRFRVSLIKKPDASVSDILSEGEYRCIAIAAFLAELATTESRSTLVFDDPVSSLDHMHRRSLAERFAQEAKKRQVIVFTHDLSFLFLLNRACRQEGTDVNFRSITRGPEAAGFCHLELPLKAKPVTKRVTSVQNRLNNEQVLYQQGDLLWDASAASMMKELRDTWELAVEEVLGPVFNRLDNEVDTKGLSKLTVLSEADCETMRESFGRCSVPQHTESKHLNPPAIKPDAIQKEIDTLKSWFEEIRLRQSKVKTLTFT